MIEQKKVTGQVIAAKLFNLHQVKLHPIAIKRVINNLIENAERYGGPSIQVRSIVESRWVGFSITDNGAGIEPSQVEALMKPFNQGEKARNQSGSGLGLAIVKRIIDRHNGHLSMTHDTGVGFVVSVKLPRR